MLRRPRTSASRRARSSGAPSQASERGQLPGSSALWRRRGSSSEGVAMNFGPSPQRFSQSSSERHCASSTQPALAVRPLPLAARVQQIEGVAAEAQAPVLRAGAARRRVVQALVAPVGAQAAAQQRVEGFVLGAARCTAARPALEVVAHLVVVEQHGHRAAAQQRAHRRKAQRALVGLVVALVAAHRVGQPGAGVGVDLVAQQQGQRRAVALRSAVRQARQRGAGRLGVDQVGRVLATAEGEAPAAVRGSLLPQVLAPALERVGRHAEGVELAGRLGLAPPVPQRPHLAGAWPSALWPNQPERA
jgi:hypothetical protein